MPEQYAKLYTMFVNLRVRGEKGGYGKLEIEASSVLKLVPSRQRWVDQLLQSLNAGLFSLCICVNKN
jgi:hypothetical protein